MPDSHWLSTHGIVAILRGDYVAHILSLTEALYAGGIRVLEITMNSPGALDLIAQLSDAYSERMWIGAGTVVEPEQVDAVADAGGRFIVSPDTYTPVIERTVMRGMEPVPGACTPSEIRTAIRAGARFIKLFPAMPAGPAYLKQLRGPLPEVQFLPTGGVGLDEIAPFVRAGAVGFGLGSSLVPKVFEATPDQIQQVTANAAAFCERLAQARGSHA